MKLLSSADVRRLVHKKYVAVLGDSIQRSFNKYLVKILQNNYFWTEKQLKGKGDVICKRHVEGSLGEMHNAIIYRQVHHYRTDHQLVRFYFLTRVSS
uniref:Uncharacterized protein n=1 Tax=Pyxicephalus adspersus TaxID=30357 RepID=A0AAV3AAK6_PYXAD|nr:TPA: hypothetical protein GDO54_018041 [Pyxicephalus adspersus]